MSTYKVSHRVKNIENKKLYNILIVDDDDDMADMFKNMLTDRGHNVTITNEAITCINKCQNSHYDIIFMDFHMNNLNGVELTDLIKDACNNTSLIFAFTGDDSNDALSQFKQIGMSGAIIKPIDPNIVCRLMNSLEMRKELDKRVVKLAEAKQLKKHLVMFT
jgi:CheY-like chemotaxis protein